MMNIAGVLVHAKPGQDDKVEKELKEIAGVEVHGVTKTGRLIVTIEKRYENLIADTVLQLHNVEGVLSAAIVYQYSDDEDEGDAGFSRKLW
jgi:nitrate reductase NapD